MFFFRIFALLALIRLVSLNDLPFPFHKIINKTNLNLKYNHVFQNHSLADFGGYNPSERPLFPKPDMVNSDNLHCRGSLCLNPPEFKVPQSVFPQIQFDKWDFISYTHPVDPDCMYVLKTNKYAESKCQMPAKCQNTDFFRFTENWWGEEYGVCVGYSPFAKYIPVFLLNSVKVSLFPYSCCDSLQKVTLSDLDLFSSMVILPLEKYTVYSSTCFVHLFPEIEWHHLGGEVKLKTFFPFSDFSSQNPYVELLKFEDCVPLTFDSLQQLFLHFNLNLCNQDCLLDFECVDFNNLPDCPGPHFVFETEVEASCIWHFNATHGLASFAPVWRRLVHCSNPLIPVKYPLTFHEDYDFPFIGNLLKVFDQVATLLLKLIEPILLKILNTITKLVTDVLLRFLDLIFSVKFPIFETLLLLIVLYIQTTKLVQSLILTFLVILPYYLNIYLSLSS